MEFNQLEYVAEVADTGSFSKAAENLFYSQPALTQQISKLEKELGVQLFHRAHGSVSLTEAGSVFAKYAHDILVNKNEALSAMNDFAQNQTGSITVLLPMERGSEMVSEFFPRFHQKFPGIVMNAIQTSVHRQLNRISRSAADLGFVLLPDTSELGGIDYHILAKESFLFAVSRANPLSQSAADINTPTEDLPVCTLNQLSQAEYALTQPFTSSNKMIMDFFAALDIKPNILLYSNTNVSTREFIRNNIACGILPSWYRTYDEEIAYFQLPKNLSWSMYAIWKKGHYRTNASFLTENLIADYLENRECS